MKKLLPYFKGSRLQCLLAPLFKMFEAILELIIPIIVAEIIDDGIALSDKNYTVRLSIQMILLGLIGFTFSITAQYFSAFAAINTVKNIKNSLYEKVLNLEISQFEQVGNDNIVTRLTTDMDSIQNGINLTLRLLLRSPFVVFGACIMAFRVSHKSIVIYFSVVLFLSVIIISVMRSSIRLNKISRNKLDSVYTSVKDYLKGTRVIRAFGIDNKIQKEFFQRNSVLTSSSIITGNINSLLNPLTTVVVNLGIIAVLKFGSENVINGTLSTGAVVALYNYMTQILTELVKFANLITTISKSTACAKRVSGLFDMKNSKNNSESSSGSEHYIEFRNVNFKYPGASEECLKNISFVAERGNKIGIVGSTGSGKSTLIQLLNGTYTPTSGQIFINGHSTTSSEFSEYKKQIATVEQKPYIFAGTIESNIDINGTIPDENRIISSLRTAEAFDFVSEYSDVIKHSINHNGNNLSGGQKQRIAIARAIAVNPEILILDDSGSSLDYYTDLKIRNAINNSEIKTVFSVSQKTASVKNSDLIIVLEDGTAEYGTHDELLKKSSVYKEIHLSQSEEENV